MGYYINSTVQEMVSTGEITTRHGTALHVEESYGGGRPVVLIHGWPLSGQS